MMFLYGGMRAEVEPVPGRKGWYQLTGKHIERWTVDVEETFSDLAGQGVKVDYKARILGIHDCDEDISLRDPRFNDKNWDEGDHTFGVYEECGKRWMLLAVNQAEYVLFRFLAPHEAGGADADEEYDPMSKYRVEEGAAKPNPQGKAALKKKLKATANG